MAPAGTTAPRPASPATVTNWRLCTGRLRPEFTPEGPNRRGPHSRPSCRGPHTQATAGAVRPSNHSNWVSKPSTRASGVVQPARAQSAAVARVEGQFHDYTADLDASGPWQLVGDWSATLRTTGQVDVSASLSMVRADNPTRSAHTHHLGLVGGTVTIPNGYRIAGAATITSNGATAPFSGSPVIVDLTGNTAVPLAKITLTFQGSAVAHFSDQPIDGVVRVP